MSFEADAAKRRRSILRSILRWAFEKSMSTDQTLAQLDSYYASPSSERLTKLGRVQSDDLGTN